MTSIEQIKHPSNEGVRKRKGRGVGSGNGKTAGRGQKGAGSRSGNMEKARFEGGQQPLVRHLPKLGGFKHHRKPVYHPVNLDRLKDVPAGTTVDLQFLESRSLLPKKLRGLRVKLLGSGGIDRKLNFQVHAYSNKARAAVEAAGGTCEVLS
jgi:large subunit ribosomal protein L15